MYKCIALSACAVISLQLLLLLCFFFQLFLVDDVNATLDPDKLWVKAWFPIMFELSTIISRCKLDVRTRSVIQEGVAIFKSIPQGASRVFLGFQGYFWGFKCAAK